MLPLKSDYIHKSDLVQLSHIVDDLKKESTTSTYKYALLNAVISVCYGVDVYNSEIRSNTDFHIDNDRIYVSMTPVIYRFARVYFQMLKNNIPQIHGGNLRFSAKLKLFERLCIEDFSNNLLDNQYPDLMTDIHKAIIAGPIKYYMGGEYFEYISKSRLTNEYADPYGYIAFKNSTGFSELYLYSLFGKIINGDGNATILLKWANWCSNKLPKNSNNFHTEYDIYTILNDEFQNERDTKLARNLINALLKTGSASATVCIWTNRSLESDYQIDHILPFSKYGGYNYLWNMLPANRSVNNSKSDKIVAKETLKQAEKSIKSYWMYYLNNEDGAYDTDGITVRNFFLTQVRNSHLRKSILAKNASNTDILNYLWENLTEEINTALKKEGTVGWVPNIV